MRGVHQYADLAAKNVTLHHRLRTKFKRKANPVHTDYHKPVLCPLGCTALVKRMTRHLQAVHLLGPREQLRVLGSQKISNTQNTPTETESGRVPSGTDAATGSTGPESVNCQPPLLKDSETTCDTTTVSIPLFLQEFNDWFLTVQGGKKDPKTATQYTMMLKAMLLATKSQFFTNMLDIEVVYLYFNELEKGQKPHKHQTRRTYITALTHFANFCTSSPLVKNMFDVQELIRYKVDLCNLSKAFKKGCAEEHWRKKEKG
jgi:hypothetical protein